MEVIIQPSARDCAAMGARIIGKLMKSKADAVLGLATGSTPLPLYGELIRMNRSGEIDFSGVTSFNLDEYIGLPGDHPCSYRYFMEQELFKDINIEPDQTHVPDGLVVDVSEQCSAYDQASTQGQQSGYISLVVVVVV